MVPATMTEPLPPGCAEGEGCGELEHRGDEEIRRWERQLMSDRQAGVIRSQSDRETREIRLRASAG